MINLPTVILTLSVAYAVIGALLLVVLVYARLHWSLKAVAVVVTSAFYVVSFTEMRGLLGWASMNRLPTSFKLNADQRALIDKVVPQLVKEDPEFQRLQDSLKPKTQ